jgi:FkbH-like protein
VHPFRPVDLTRIAQLVSKSNQFNLTTRRYSQTELAALAEEPDTVTVSARLEDRFGDAGLISVVIAKPDAGPSALLVDTWLMSCRVLKRGVEQALLNVLVAEARRRGYEHLLGEYIPSSKNRMVANHYRELGFEPVPWAENRWRLSLADYKAREVHMCIEQELR